eukprot:5952895-Alexandrium_andersonii.AAC.1
MHPREGRLAEMARLELARQARVRAGADRAKRLLLGARREVCGRGGGARPLLRQRAASPGRELVYQARVRAGADRVKRLLPSARHETQDAFTARGACLVHTTRCCFRRSPPDPLPHRPPSRAGEQARPAVCSFAYPGL